MEPTASKQQLLEIKMDMKLLLECLDYQKDNPSSMKQALVTLSAILQGSGEAKTMFREVSGLQAILAIVTDCRHDEVAEAGLYCLGSAVEKNGKCRAQQWLHVQCYLSTTATSAYSQKLLSTASTFTFLHGIMSSKRASVRKKQTAAFLILCLVSNNGFGQNLARQSSCLQDVISLIRTCLPTSVADSTSDWFETADGTSLELWSTLVSTASVCVNNPVNDGNQRLCASLLPYLFSLLQAVVDPRVGRPILSLVGLTVANNVANQDRVRKCGGLDIFVSLLKQLVNKMDDDHDKKTFAVQLLSTLDACISENEESSRQVGRLGGIRPLMMMLTTPSMDDQNKTQVVLTLAHAVDTYAGNQQLLLEDNGMTCLIQQLTLTEDEELSKTIKYLLHMCVPSDRRNEENGAPDADILADTMEEMKRNSELQMLQKIGELDKKLESMQREATERAAQIELLESSSHCTTPQRHVGAVGIFLSGGRSLNKMSDGDNRSCRMTPREQSLLQQLQKEQAERRRLEALNEMLHKDTSVGHLSSMDAATKLPQGEGLAPHHRDLSVYSVDQYEPMNRVGGVFADVPINVPKNQEIQLVSNCGDGNVQQRLVSQQGNIHLPQQASGYTTQMATGQSSQHGNVPSYLSNVNDCKNCLKSGDHTQFIHSVTARQPVPTLTHGNVGMTDQHEMYSAQKLPVLAPVNNNSTSASTQYVPRDQGQSDNRDSSYKGGENSAFTSVSVDTMQPLYQDENICVMSRKSYEVHSKELLELEDTTVVTAKEREIASENCVNNISGYESATLNASNDALVKGPKKQINSTCSASVGQARHCNPAHQDTRRADTGSKPEVDNKVATAASRTDGSIIVRANNTAICKACCRVPDNNTAICKACCAQCT